MSVVSLFTTADSHERLISFFDSIPLNIVWAPNKSGAFYEDASSVAALCLERGRSLISSSDENIVRGAIKAIAKKWPEKVENTFDLAQKHIDAFLKEKDVAFDVKVVADIAALCPQGYYFEKMAMDTLYRFGVAQLARGNQTVAMQGFSDIVSAKPHLASQAYYRIKKMIVVNDERNEGKLLRTGYLKQAGVATAFFMPLQACFEADKSLAPFIFETMAKPLLEVGYFENPEEIKELREWLTAFVKADEGLHARVWALASAMTSNKSWQFKKPMMEGLREDFAGLMPHVYGPERGKWTPDSLMQAACKL